MLLLAVIIKETALLMRDKIGLLILFILPLFLLVLVSLTQHSMNDSSASLKVLLVNQDKGEIGKKLARKISTQSKFSVIAYNGSETQAKNQVSKGNYNALIIINKNLSKDVKKNMRTLARNPKRTNLKLNSVVLYTDPALPQTLVKTFKTALDYLLQSTQLLATQNTLLRVERIKGETKLTKWFEVKQKYALNEGKSEIILPNSVQQNVPAWTLFGMFFIVIPLAGQMVRERSLGVIQRIRIAPTPQIFHLLGRVICYLVLNLLQMSLMILVGVFVLPQMGLPALNIQQNLALIYLVGIFASLSAIGFGLLIGMYATSLQQATIAAPFIVIIAASVSGIFVPMVVMPEALTYFSNASPLYWAQTAFLDIFVRGVRLNALLPSLFKLLGFFLATLILSLLPFTRILQQRKVK